jgi:hypothetical protein
MRQCVGLNKHRDKKHNYYCWAGCHCITWRLQSAGWPEKMPEQMLLLQLPLPV